MLLLTFTNKVGVNYAMSLIHIYVHLTCSIFAAFASDLAVAVCSERCPIAQFAPSVET